MSSHHGSAKKKSVPQPTIQDETPQAAKCICCHCDATFSPLEVEGKYLRRTCPSCGGVLNEANYDDAFMRAARELKTTGKDLSVASSEIGVWSAKAEKFHLAIFKPIRFLLTLKANKARSHAADIRLHHQALKDKLEALALSRYYTGEWFQRTRTPLEGTGATPHKINVQYSNDGQWHICHTDQTSAGIVGEFRVFDRLLKKVRDKSSPLYGAQIVPNLYIPHTPQGRRPEKLWSQIDCTVLTQQAAFVIEVKRRAKRIATTSPFYEIWSTDKSFLMGAFSSKTLDKHPQDAGFTSESFALSQNSKHALAINEECDAYPYERIYEQVVFVDTTSFFTNCHKFVDNVNVAPMCRSSSDFASIIEAEIRRLDKIVSKDELDDLGESLLAAYGNLDKKEEPLYE